MKSRIAILSVIAAGLSPSLAYAAEGAESAGGWFQLVFYAINFLLFIWIVKHYGGSTISGFFHDRARTIRETMGRAEKAFKDAQELANLAAERMAKLEAEKAKIASDLADETIYQVGRIYDVARETAARIKRDTELTAAALREGGQRRLRETMAAAAGRIAHDLLERNFQPDDQKRLLDGFVEKLGEEARR